MLSVGMPAPDFTLPDKDGKEISLKDFRGKKTVIYFYPKDMTPGCTKQACAFAGAYGEFMNLNAEIIGISKDSPASHGKFTEKYSLPFILLSDESTEVLQSYGVWQEKNMYGKKYMGIVRTTFIIDEQGNIEKIMPKVKPDKNPEDVLKYLKGE